MEVQTGIKPANDLEIMRKMEDDHLHLQRQVRMIQTDRLQRTMGVHPQFRRQDNLLKTLKMEYLDLVLDLKIARSGAHKKKDKNMKRGLKRSLLLREETDVECDGGLAVTDELQGLMQASSKEMLRLRKLVSASQGKIEARRFHSERRLVSAENSLETAERRFNAVQSQNQAIRREINHMLRDRAIFNQAWNKMLAALGKGTKFLSDLFESSTLAYDQRDEWVSKLRSIQEKGKMDQMLQVQEMRDLKKAYDHEMRVYLFLAKKGIMRVNPRQQKKEEERKKKMEEEMKRDFDKYNAILDEINDYTQEPCYNKIIDDFGKREQENFSTYQLICHNCAENEVLSRELNKIQQEIEDRREWNEMMEAKRQKKMEILNEQLQKQRERTNTMRDDHAQKEKIIQDTMEKVHDIFRMLECSLEPFQNLLGDKQPSLHQLRLTLCLITDKIKEHVHTVYYYERAMKRSEKSSTSRLKKFLVRAEPPETFTPRLITELVEADPCPSEVAERPLDKVGVLSALSALAAEPAYVRSDRVHALADCRATASRRLLATRHHY